MRQTSHSGGSALQSESPFGSGFTSSRGSSSSDKPPSRTLIICIDRDDDVGVKTGIKTPIIGRDACVSAATQFSISDPEEADANAIFAAVKEYDGMLSKGELCEVVVVSGLFERGILGDRKIRNQVAEILKGYPADGAVIVSDGQEGEDLVPVIQGLVPIISLRKVVIKHSKSVEESYQVLGRYLRMLIFDPRYTKYALGVPGIIFLALVLIYNFSPKSAPIVLIGFIAIVFIIRGFDIDRKIESIGKLSAAGYLRLFSFIASILVILVGFAQGIAAFFPLGGTCTSAPCLIGKAVAAQPGLFLSRAPQIAGYFIENGQLYIWLGIAIYITTSIFFSLLRSSSRRIARYLVELFVVGLLYFPVSIFANTLIAPRGNNTEFFVAIILFALAVNFTIAAYVYRFFSRRRKETQAIEV